MNRILLPAAALVLAMGSAGSEKVPPQPEWGEAGIRRSRWE